MKSWSETKRDVPKVVEEAMWQFFIDHSRINPDASWFVCFAVRDIDDFWKRVNARETERFRRYDMLVKLNTQHMVKSLRDNVDRWDRINSNALKIPVFRRLWIRVTRWLDKR